MDGQRKYTIAGIAAAVLGAVAVMIFVYACLLAGHFEKKVYYLRRRIVFSSDISTDLMVFYT